MSKFLTTSAIQQFDSEVKHEYQEMGFQLRGTTRVKTGVVGTQTRFQKMGEGVAKERNASQSDVVPMNVAHSTVPCPMTNWDASEYTDIFDASQVNFDERQELAKAIAGGLGRRSDQLILDALAAGSLAVIEDIPGADAKMSTEFMVAIKDALDNANVPGQGRVFVCRHTQISQLLNTTQATSSDFATIKTLVRGEIDTWLGFRFIPFGVMTEGGIKNVGTDDFCYAYHRTAVGYAEGISETTEVNYVPQKKSWLSSGHTRAGACIIDVNGARECKVNEAL